MKTVIKNIKVTKTGIRKGIVQNDSCPIARGMIAAGIKSPCVDNSEIAGTYRKASFKIKTPRYISRWITKFDNGNSLTPNRKVSPFNFNLRFKA